jgi:hypothetical protein
LVHWCLTGQPLRRRVVPSALAYLKRSSTSERLGHVVGRVASLEENCRQSSHAQNHSIVHAYQKQGSKECSTHKSTKRVLQSTTSSVSHSLLQLAYLLLVTGRNLVDVALGQVACFVFTHRSESLVLELSFELGWDAEPVFLVLVGSY